MMPWFLAVLQRVSFQKCCEQATKPRQRTRRKVRVVSGGPAKPSSANGIFRCQGTFNPSETTRHVRCVQHDI